MTNAEEKRVGRIAESKGYRLEKVGKGLHHGRFSIVKKAGGSRCPPVSLAPSSRSRFRKQKIGWPKTNE